MGANRIGMGAAMIETGEDLRRARHALGLSVTALAEALRVRHGYLWDIEEGRRDVTGPIAVSVEAMLAGYKPEDFG